MTPEELKDIKARADKATPGPWEYILEDNGVDSNYGFVVNPSCGKLSKGHWITNGEFIAHAREDIPKLINEVEKLQAEIAASIPSFKQIISGVDVEQERDALKAEVEHLKLMIRVMSPLESMG